MRPSEIVDALRREGPRVHCIVGTVSMNYVANALLAAGGRPMMTETPTEAPAITTAADALLINLGTLSADATAGIGPTVHAAQDVGVPFVLDPTAIGRAPVRTPLARTLAAKNPSVIRCNASELTALAGESAGVGPDASESVEDHTELARELAAHLGCVVAVSGPVDVVTDGVRLARVRGGDPLLTRVTGTGCALGALTAACVALADDPFDAALASHALMAAAGCRAAAASEGPGDFAWRLLNALDAVPATDLEELIDA